MERFNSKEFLSRINRKKSTSSEYLYKWESSVPDILKKDHKKLLRRISYEPQKISSIDYMKFSDKILDEYSKVSTKRLTFNQASIKNSFRSQTNNDFINSTQILRSNTKMHKHSNSIQIFGKNPSEKIQKLKNFEFYLPDKKADNKSLSKISFGNIFKRVKKPKKNTNSGVLNSIFNPTTKTGKIIKEKEILNSLKLRKNSKKYN